MIAGDNLFINGDGETSRDFCFIKNTVHANILAATANDKARNQVYNVAVADPIYRDFRVGDVCHS